MCVLFFPLNKAPCQAMASAVRASGRFCGSLAVTPAPIFPHAMFAPSGLSATRTPTDASERLPRRANSATHRYARNTSESDDGGNLQRPRSPICTRRFSRVFSDFTVLSSGLRRPHLQVKVHQECNNKVTPTASRPLGLTDLRTIISPRPAMNLFVLAVTAGPYRKCHPEATALKSAT
jgi:hypothetical protein